MADTLSTPKKTAKGAAGQATGSAKKTASSAKKSNPGRHAEETASEAGGTETGDVTNGVTENGASEANGAAEDVEGEAESVGDEAEGVGEDAEGAAEDAGEDAEGNAEDAAGEAQDTAEDAGEQAEEAGGDVQDAIAAGSVDKDGNVVDEQGNVIGKLSEGDAAKLGGSTVDQEGDVLDEEGNILGKAQLGGGDAAGDAAGKAGDAAGEAQSEVNKLPDYEGQLTVKENGDIVDATDKVIGKLKDGDAKSLVGKEIKDLDLEGNLLGEDGTILGKMDLPSDEAAGEEAPLDYTLLDGKKVNKSGKIVDENGDVFGTLIDGDPKVCAGKECDEAGKIFNDKGKQIGQAQPLSTEELQPLIHQPFEDFPGATVDAEGNVVFEGKTVGKVVEGDIKKLEGKQVDADGDIADKNGNVIGKAERPKDEEPEPEEEIDYSVLEGKKVNKAGKIVEENGNIIGTLVEGETAKCVGRACDAEGKIWNDSGKILGRGKPIPKSEQEAPTSKPFEDFPGAVVDRKGNVNHEGNAVGKVVEGDLKKLEGKEVDADGDIADKNGNVIGRAERIEDEPEPEVNFGLIEGKKVNKQGNVTDDSGRAIGRVTEGNIKTLNGKTVQKEGKIYGDSGDVIGKARPLSEDELEPAGDEPFSDFPDSIVVKNGDVTYEDRVIGKVIEGDPKKLAGKKVDPEGDIVDKVGNVLGKAERVEEEEAAPVDLSPLSGKRVNKLGNVVDEHGSIYGKIVDGDPKKLAGKMCDKNGQIFDEAGTVIGHAELVPDSERAGAKEGPFAAFDTAIVRKDGFVTDAAGKVIGKLTQGDGKTLEGHHVDEDGDISDKNGNTIGKAERYEEEEKPKDKHPCSGYKVNKEGNVVDSNGDVIGKLTEGDAKHCRGKEVDDDGDVVDQKGTTVGHVTPIDDVEEEETGPTEEELAAKQKAEEEEAQAKEDADLANKLSNVVEQTIDRMKPVLSQISDHLEKAERTPKDELDEEELVKKVQPLIEEGGRILSECNGSIRGLDPDGSIQAKAKSKAGTREATPEEHRLADLLKTLTENVTTSIDKAKKRIADMPHAKKKLNPLWGLLSEPLGQILAAVGLLLSGVLGLVGKLLGGLGLGGIVNNLLGGLGITNILDSVGVDLGGMLGGGKKK
ncbi:MAG: hypothetical protein M4579_002115 [Chaenotheca gracillima]|nr:MAG: hypothetical protein M4579_002115 [Chaenotheca gracillima]